MLSQSSFEEEDFDEMDESQPESAFAHMVNRCQIDDAVSGSKRLELINFRARFLM